MAHRLHNAGRLTVILQVQDEVKRLALQRVGILPKNNPEVAKSPRKAPEEQFVWSCRYPSYGTVEAMQQGGRAYNVTSCAQLHNQRIHLEKCIEGDSPSGMPEGEPEVRFSCLLRDTQAGSGLGYAVL